MTAPKKLTAVEALQQAQWIAFAPTVFQAARCLRDTGILAAVESAGAQGLSSEQIEQQAGLSRYAARVLLEAGTGIGLVAEREGRYTLTRTGHFILNDAMTRRNMDFSHDVTYQGMFDLEASLRSGKPEGLKRFGDWRTIYEALAHLPENMRRSWFGFDHFYSDAAFEPALAAVFKDPPQRLLDIGGNTGRWARRCLDRNAQVHVGLFDLPGQLALARRELAGDAGRVSFHEGNVLEAALPAGYDAIWMSQFLDCFSETQIVAILKACAAAIAPGGRIFVLEPFWDRQRFPAGAFCLQQTSLYFTALANGNSQMYRSKTFLDCVRQAGLAVRGQDDAVGMFHTLLTCGVA